MSHLDRMRDARQAVMADALARWRRRAGEREQNQADLDSKGPGAADSAGRVARLAAREAGFAQAATMRREGRLPLGVERKMGPTLDFIEFPPSEAARRAGRPVARLVTLEDPGIELQGYATGFLIAPNLLITNHHVFQDRFEAVGAGANFLYERAERGVQQGVTFELDPDTFFLTNPALDYSVVAVKPAPARGTRDGDLGTLFLIEATPKILVGQPVQIIQYPQGKPKAYAIINDRLIDILDEGFLQYETDTEEGSSGSPAFSKNWELVALHHASIPLMRGNDVISTDGSVWTEAMGDDKVKWIANEGVRVSAVVKDLSARTVSDSKQRAILDALLATTTDPLDDLAQMASPAADARAPRAAPESKAAATRGATPAPSARQTMAGPSLLFTGPVTINIYGEAPAATGMSAQAEPVLTVDPSAQATVGVEKKLRFDPDYAHREGYDPNFLGVPVPVPAVSDGRAGEMLTDAAGHALVLRYHHFELAMNRPRRLMMWSAVNVDYDPAKKAPGGRAAFGRDEWHADPRIPAAAQLQDADFYKPAGKVDRGHIVRREDNAWGKTPMEQEFANSDTFHWTNCTPQHEAFNRADPGRSYGTLQGLWGGFEQQVQQGLQDVDHRACLLAGPALAADDPSADFGAGPIQYPLLFWKVVCVTVSKAGMKAGGTPRLMVFGFLLSQQSVTDRFGIERFGPGKFARYQATLTHIEEVTGLVFDHALHAADTMRDASAPRRAIQGASDIQGLQSAA